MDQQMRCQDQQRLLRYETKRGTTRYHLAKLHLKRIAELLCACTAMFAADSTLACWDACSVVPTKNGATPQTACEFASAEGVGHARPFRIGWIKEGGDYEGFYHVGTDVPGPPIPNPENDYRPYSPSAPYCIIDEFSLCRLDYYKSPSCDAVSKKIVAIDPGHGFACASKGMPPGAIGVTDFPPSNPPPGWLLEDDLTMAIAREFQRLASGKYTVVLTKNSATPCPEYRERGQVAIKAKANAFISIHINRRNPIPGNPFANGTSAIYNSDRPAAAKTLADLMAANVSASLGVNNRGAIVDDGLALLKDTVTPKMIAVLVEAARLSGSDEEKLHAPGAATKVATGIKAALDAFFGN